MSVFDNSTPQGEAAQADDTREFDQAWDEAASSRSAPADAAADEHEDDPASTDPVETAPEAETSGTPAEAAAPAPAEQPDDIWANATPAQREAFQSLQRDADHRERSLRGRLSALDRTVQELRGGTPAAPSQGQQEQPRDTAADDLLASDQFKQFQEEYGEIATPIASVLKTLQDKVNALSGSVGQVEQDRTAAALDANAQALTERHPDWLDCAKDARFNGWLETQPASVRQAAQRNWDAIVDPEDAGLVFERFKAAHNISAAAAPAPSPTPTPSPTPAADPKRKRQLESGRDAGIRSAPAASGEPDDFDAAWSNAARKADARRQPQRTL